MSLFSTTRTTTTTTMRLLRLRHHNNSTRRYLAAAAADNNNSNEPLIKTALNEWHKELGGDMVPFAGYELPVLYKEQQQQQQQESSAGAIKSGGVMKEHLWCRTTGQASLFDVSHMGQIRWYGQDRVSFLERIVVSDIAGLAVGSGCLSLVTNAQGGILDDTVITNAGDYIYMVVNGATKHADMQHFQEQMAEFKSGSSSSSGNADVQMEYLEDSMQLLAVQGPGAAAAVAKLLPTDFDLTHMAFMTGKTNTTLDGIEGCRITRCGYTGEDGFELAMPAQHAVSIASKLIEDPTVNPAGLGARDSLRLEAGLCLYGHDLDANTNPIEAALGWTIGPPKSRRRLEGGFLGAEHILTPDGKFQKVTRKRVGIQGMKAPAREHTEIYDATGEKQIGVVTSGTFSPCLKAPIAMGYVETASSKVDTEVQLKIRGKMQKAVVTKMPFVETRYYKVPE